MFLGAEEPWSILDTESTGPRRRLARLRPVCSAPSRAPAPAAITLEPCYGNIICDYQRHLTIVILHCTRAVTVYNISRRRRNMLNRWRLYIHITWRGGCIQGTRDKGRGGRDVQGMLTARQRRFAGVRSRPAAAARFRPGRLFFAGVTGGADLQRARPGAASGANVASASFTGESARRGDGGVDGAVGAASRAGASPASSAGR